MAASRSGFDQIITPLRNVTSRSHTSGRPDFRIVSERIGHHLP
ncbi:MAG: hypothetical protein ACLVK4_12515 [Alistipes shahii]